MHTLSRKLALTGVTASIAAAALIATACSSSPHTTSQAGSSSASASSATVKTQNGPLGRYLADGSGRALYLFGSDTSSTSSCSGACAALWPPLTAKGPVSAIDGATSGDLATIARPDGTKQVTYAGHPLYYFAGDNGAGQTNGQGVNEFGALWWLVAPSGEKNSTTADSAAPSMSSGYHGGY